MLSHLNSQIFSILNETKLEKTNIIRELTSENISFIEQISLKFWKIFSNLGSHTWYKWLITEKLEVLLNKIIKTENEGK